MSEWKEYKLEDFALINPTERLSKGSIAKKIAMEFLQPFTKKIPSFSFEEYKGGTKFRNGDTIMARITPSLENGKTSFVDILDEDEIGFGSTEFIVLRERKNISDKDFIFYLTISPIVRNTAIKSMTGSSGRQRVQTDVVKQHKLLVPNLLEQKQIAEILTSLDDKIDLLHRQNKTLEAMAEALFRQWFIEPARASKSHAGGEAEEDWKTGKLGDVIKLYDNLRVPLSKMERNKRKEGKLYPYFGAAKIMDFVNGYIFDGDYILLGEDGTVKTSEGYPVLQYATGKFWVNNHTHVIKAKYPYNNFFIWNYLLKKDITKIITGAVQPKINQGNLKSLDFPKYPKDLVSKFNNKTIPLFDKINQNKIQISTLEKLRDTLLPKLINGEVIINIKI